jgi:hypothetical protein
VLGKFVRPSDLRERDTLGDGESRPACLKCGVDITRRRCFSFRRKVITSQKEELNIFEDHRPKRDRRAPGIRGVGGDGTAHLQDFDVALDIRPESDFDNMIDSAGS